MRRAARTDANQLAIVEALRAAGASVYAMGKPVDLLVGFRGVNYVLECKDGTKYACHRPLTKAQQEFIPNWRGTVHVVLNVDEALAVLHVEQVQGVQGVLA